MLEPPQLPTIVRAPETVVWQELDDQIVLLELNSGEFHQFDEIGSRMWMTLIEAGEVSESIRRLLAIYEVDRDVLSQDLGVFIAELVEHGLLVPA